MKFSLAFGAWLGLIIQVMAQTDPASGLTNRIVPPSPEAASLGKYGEIPVSLASGLPNVSIPLYEIKTSRLSIPIGLNYHAAGIKAYDISSCVGLGWSLSAGFSITRVIKGLPDEDPRGMLNNPFPEESATSSTVGEHWVCLYGKLAQPLYPVDGQSDDFFYTLPRSNGKFIFRNVKDASEPREVYTIPLTPLKIAFTGGLTSLSSFNITDVNGTSYKFEQRETTTTTGPNGAIFTNTPMTWYVTSIISADKSDTVNFKYTAAVNVTTRSASRSMSVRDASQYSLSSNTSYANSIFETVHSTVNISEITYGNGKVVFHYSTDRTDQTNGRRLTSISIYSKTGSSYAEFKRFSLAQSYFHAAPGQISKVDGFISDNEKNTKLKLDSISELGISEDTTITIPPHIFEYENPNNLPAYATTAQDFMGYYNGAHANKDLLFYGLGQGLYGQEISTTLGANRKVDPFYVKNGSLKKVTYPTGGSTSFVMEAGHYQYTRDVTKPRTVGSGTYTANSRADVYEITMPAIDVSANAKSLEGVLQIDFTNNIAGEPLISTQVTVKDLTDNSIPATVGLNAGLPYYSYRGKFEVKPGHIYKLTTGPKSWQETRNFVIANISWSATDGTVTETVTETEYSGGLHLASMINDDGSGNTIQKNYIYKDNYFNSNIYNGDMAQMADLFRTRTNRHVPIENGNTREFSFDSYGENPTFQMGSSAGTVASFATIEEVRINSKGIAAGRTVYTFPKTTDDIPSMAPAMRTDNESIRQQVLSQTIYKVNERGVEVPIKKVVNDYDNTTIENIRSYWSILSEEVDVLGNIAWLAYMECNDVPTLNVYKYGAFDQPVFKSNLISRTTSEYDETGNNPHTTLETFTYGNPDHQQVTRVTMEASDGQIKTTNHRYPEDFAVLSCIEPHWSDYTSDLNTAIVNRNVCEAKYYGKVLDLTYGPYFPYQVDSINAAFGSYRNCQTLFHNNVYRNVIGAYSAKTELYADCISRYIREQHSDGDKGLVILQRDHVLDVPIETTSGFVSPEGENIIAASRIDFKPVADAAVPGAIWNLNVNSATKSNFDQNSAKYYRKAGAFDQYDGRRNLIQRSKTNDIATSYIWGYNGQYPIAEATNAVSSDVAYTSFEPDSPGNWIYSSSSVNTTSSRTGKQSYTLGGAVSRSGLTPGKTYTITFWAKPGSSVTVNGTTLKPVSSTQRNGWSFYRGTVTASSTTTSVTISGSGVIDELRCYPIEAKMTTYTFDPSAGITTSTDANNQVTYYSYDALKRLMVIQDDRLNTMKTFNYHYKTN